MYRGWFINPVAVSHWWLVIVAIVPALLATILVFLDQQITAVIVNRSEHKLVVSSLNFFALCLQIVLILAQLVSCKLVMVIGIPSYFRHFRILGKYTKEKVTQKMTCCSCARLPANRVLLIHAK